MKYGIIALTKGAIDIALKIKNTTPDSVIYTLKKNITDNMALIDDDMEKFTGKIFNRHKVLIFIMAIGIVIRLISKYIKDKTVDPAVLVIDEKGKYVISLLSGHIGMANEEAEFIAKKIKANPVITTSSDVNDKISVDMLAKKLNCTINDMQKAKEITSMIVNNEKVAIVSNYQFEIPDYFVKDKNRAKGIIFITNKIINESNMEYVRLIPKNIIVGIGCKKDISTNNIIEFIDKNLKELNIDKSAIKNISTISLKNNEKGIIETAKHYNVDIRYYDVEEIKQVEDLFQGSDFVKKIIGVGSVCEPCAYLSSNKTGKMILAKQSHEGITCAFWEEDINNNRKRKIYVVGIGPGDRGNMSLKAIEAINDSDVVIGYKKYIELIDDLIIDKKTISSGMKKEIDRCKKAIELSKKGNIVSLISSGDPGIYGMAGILLELISDDDKIDVEVVPGITAALASSAKLGSPLVNDFVVISLSDLLTDWNVIKKRLEAAAKGDFVIALYNPKSKRRTTQIETARNILLKYRDKTTPVGIVKNCNRDNEKVIITTLEKFNNFDIDMFTTLIIGNSKTFVKKGRMITSRGYMI